MRHAARLLAIVATVGSLLAPTSADAFQQTIYDPVRKCYYTVEFYDILIQTIPPRVTLIGDVDFHVHCD